MTFNGKFSFRIKLIKAEMRQIPSTRNLVIPRPFIAVLFVHLAIVFSFSEQASAHNDVVVDLKNGTAQQIASAISSLDQELLNRDAVVAQLVLLLNDDRTVTQHLMGRRSVRDYAWRKLFQLEAASVLTIVNRIPELESDRARGLALEAIASIGSPDEVAFSEILKYCQHDSVYVRSRAIMALSAVGDHSTTTVDQLGQFLNDPDPLVRSMVLGALCDRRESIDKLIPAIAKMLDDDSDVYVAISNHAITSEKLRVRVASLLTKLGSSAAIALPKLETLTAPQFDTNVRVWAATAICAISEVPPKEALELLGELLLSDRDNRYSRNASPKAIQELGPLAAPLLDQMELAKDHRSPQVRWGLVEAFFAVDPPSAVQRVLPMMEDEHKLVVRTVIRMLSSRGISDADVIDAYIRALDNYDDPFHDPASSAVDALTQLGPVAHKAVPALKRLLVEPRISDTFREDLVSAIAAIDVADDDQSND